MHNLKTARAFTTSFYLMILLLLFTANEVKALNITLINPDKPGRPFWDLCTEIAQAAAEDLQINLEVIYGGGDRFSNQDVIQHLSLTDKNIDYLIFLPREGNALQSFTTLEKAKIPFITLERAIEANEFSAFGHPKKRFKYWIDDVHYDDSQAGKLLTKALINKSRSQGIKHQYITALNGDHSAISSKREQGLRLALEKNTSLNQIIYTMWHPVKAEQQTPYILKRYPNTNIFWAASDELALAAYAALIKSKNQQVVTGGIGGTPSAINSIKKGQLTATVGGHYMQVAWALIKAYDHSKGINNHYIDQGIPFNLVTGENVQDYNALTAKPNWRNVDFTDYSLFLNPKLDQYNFSLESIIKAL